MKTIINGYLQEDLLKANIDLVDIEIIKYFEQFQLSKNMKHKEHEGKLFFWLSYQKIIDDLPIINIKSKRSITRRFKDMEDKGIFERLIINTGMKNYSYLRLTELHQSWIENMDVRFKSHTKSIEIIKEEVDSIPYKEIIEFLNKTAGRNFNFKTESHRIDIRKRWNEDFDLEDFKKVIIIKTEEWINDNKFSQYLQPSTLFGNKMDQYLNQRTKGNNNANNGAEQYIAPKD